MITSIIQFHLKPFRPRPSLLPSVHERRGTHGARPLRIPLPRPRGSARVRRTWRGSPRVEGHSLGTHNIGLAELIAKNAYTLEIAGPYRISRSSAAVESALISALRIPATPRLTNIAPGDGPKFVPLGAPLALAERGATPPLSIEDLGRSAGGILLCGGPLQASSRSISIERSTTRLTSTTRSCGRTSSRCWKLAQLLRLWTKTGEWPPVVAGLAGPTKRRYVTGALRTVSTRGSRFLTSSGSKSASSLRSSTFDLRGQRVENARFGQFNIAHHIWVDGERGSSVRAYVAGGGSLA